MPDGAPDARFCCRGCEAVHALLVGEGLTRFYALQTQRVPVGDVAREHGFAWLEPLVRRAEAAGPLCALELDVQGVHCAGCVWLMEELFRRQAGGAGLTVNPALGKVSLRYRRGFDVAGFLSSVERFGYRFGPDRKRAHAASSGLALRLGICAAITINVMLFSFAFYVGLAPADGEVFTLFSRLTLALSVVVVLVGGSVFFRSAWRGLRSGVLHLDLPIAVGILLAFGASLWQARTGRGDRAYLDTLDVFVTLMLVGRWLQERVLERNRRFLLEDDGLQGLTVRRRVGERLETIEAARVAPGDALVIAPGDLVPVDAVLLDEAASVTTDWITGEPDVRAIARGERLPAGACNAGRTALTARAETRLADSPLPRLLGSGGSSRGVEQAWARLWRRVARTYVLVVLALAAAALALWWPRDPARAVDVTVALLVVTCPCALGIAGPMAYELVLARLRRRGFFVRSPDLLDKLTRVRTIIFDKTGTLTLGRPRLVGGVETLAPALRDAAFDMVARSSHPVSRCLHDALARAGARFDAAAAVVEEPGRGLRLERDGHVLRLGAPDWAAPGAPALEGTTVLSVDGQAVHTFVTGESLRPDARAELDRLRETGCDVWLLSGDDPRRVAEVARALGIPADHALGALRPEDKAAQVARIDREDTLYLGDGVNDALAFERALCAGTPAIDRPVLPGKADFFLLGDGVAALREALTLAARLRAVVRRNLAVALAYNTIAVAACFAGLMTPLRAALAMPLSSLSILFWTIASLSERSRHGHPDRAGLRQPPAGGRRGPAPRLQPQAGGSRARRPPVAPAARGGAHFASAREG